MKSGDLKVEKTKTKSKSYLWIVSSAFGASIIPAVVALIINLIWFLLFWKPFANWFPALFPVSQYFWFPLLLLIINAGLLVLRYNYENNQKRERLYVKFCTASLNVVNGNIRSNLLRNYLTWRGKGDPLRMLTLIQGSESDNATKQTLIECYMKSIQLDKQSRPIILYTISYVSLWLFVFSVPFLYWGFYGKWYGLFGFLLVTWPLIAYIHGPAYPVNYYQPYEKSAFILTDYLAIAEMYERISLQK